ncbi:MAG: AAA family ATPase, partial [Elusimicrobia bacterium]|nr:AAA family ATPase [Elusimicrobiota bacterium]
QAADAAAGAIALHLLGYHGQHDSLTTDMHMENVRVIGDHAVLVADFETLEDQKPIDLQRRQKDVKGVSALPGHKSLAQRLLPYIVKKLTRDLEDPQEHERMTQVALEELGLSMDLIEEILDTLAGSAKKALPLLAVLPALLWSHDAWAAAAVATADSSMTILWGLPFILGAALFWEKHDGAQINPLTDLAQIDFGNDLNLPKVVKAAGELYEKLRDKKPRGSLGGRREKFTQRDLAGPWALSFRIHYLRLKALQSETNASGQPTELARKMKDHDAMAALIAFYEATEFTYGVSLDYEPNNPALSQDQRNYAETILTGAVTSADKPVLIKLAEDLGLAIPPARAGPNYSYDDGLDQLCAGITGLTTAALLDKAAEMNIDLQDGEKPVSYASTLGSSGAQQRSFEKLNQEFITEVAINSAGGSSTVERIESSWRLLRHIMNSFQIELTPLLVGPTGTGKSLAVKFLAALNGKAHLTINMKPNIGNDEMIGGVGPAAHGLAWQWGFLIKAMVSGDWVTLEEFNLAPTDVLEALNEFFSSGIIRLTQHLDEESLRHVLPAELFKELKKEGFILRPHLGFRMALTMNPDSYTARKKLSNTIANRLVKIWAPDYTPTEMERILGAKYDIPMPRAVSLVENIYFGIKLAMAGRRLGSAHKDKYELNLRTLLNAVKLYKDNVTQWSALNTGQPPDPKTDLLLLARALWETYGFMMRSETDRNVLWGIFDAALSLSAEGITRNDLMPNVTAIRFDAAANEVVIEDALLPLRLKLRPGGSFVPPDKFDLPPTPEALNNLYWISRRISRRESLILVGETAAGKTSHVQYLHRLLHAALYYTNLSSESADEELTGSFAPDPTSPRKARFVPGLLERAGKEYEGQGTALFIDEINLSSIVEYLNAAHDDRQLITPYGAIPLGPETITIGAMNPPKPGENEGRIMLSPAVRGRYWEAWIEEPEKNEMTLRLGHRLAELFKAAKRAVPLIMIGLGLLTPNIALAGTGLHEGSALPLLGINALIVGMGMVAMANLGGKQQGKTIIPTLGSAPSKELKGHTSYAFSASWSPDGTRLATSSGNEAIIWDTATGEPLRFLHPPTPKHSWDKKEPFREVHYSVSGQTVLTESHFDTIAEWDPDTGQLLIQYKLSYKPDQSTDRPSPDGKRVITIDRKGKGILKWTLIGEIPNRLLAEISHAEFVWSPDSASFASICYLGPIRRILPWQVVIWNADGKEIHRLPALTRSPGISFSPNGRQLAVFDNYGVVTTWNVQTGRKIKEFSGNLITEGHTGLDPMPPLFSPDGSLIVTPGPNNIIYLHHVTHTPEQLAEMEQRLPETVEPTGTIKPAAPDQPSAQDRFRMFRLVKAALGHFGGTLKNFLWIIIPALLFWSGQSWAGVAHPLALGLPGDHGNLDAMLAAGASGGILILGGVIDWAKRRLPGGQKSKKPGPAIEESPEKAPGPGDAAKEPPPPTTLDDYLEREKVPPELRPKIRQRVNDLWQVLSGLGLVFSGRSDVEFRIGQWWVSDLEVKTIYIPLAHIIKHLDNFPAMVGGVVHESGHIWFTRWNKLPFFEKMLMDTGFPMASHSLFNILDDMIQEMAKTRQWPGVSHYLKALHTLYRADMFQDDLALPKKLEKEADEAKTTKEKLDAVKKMFPHEEYLEALRSFWMTRQMPDPIDIINPEVAEALKKTEAALPELLKMIPNETHPDEDAIIASNYRRVKFIEITILPEYLKLVQKSRENQRKNKKGKGTGQSKESKGAGDPSQGQGQGQGKDGAPGSMDPDPEDPDIRERIESRSNEINRRFCPTHGEENKEGNRGHNHKPDENHSPDQNSIPLNPAQRGDKIAPSTAGTGPKGNPRGDPPKNPSGGAAGNTAQNNEGPIKTLDLVRKLIGEHLAVEAVISAANSFEEALVSMASLIDVFTGRLENIFLKNIRPDWDNEHYKNRGKPDIKRWMRSERNEFRNRGDWRLYRRKRDPTRRSHTVATLIDRSGSTNGLLPILQNITGLLMEAFDRLGINQAHFAFDRELFLLRDYSPDQDDPPKLTHEEKSYVLDQLAKIGGGSTYDAEAVYSVLKGNRKKKISGLGGQPGDTRVLFVITDGQGNGSASAQMDQVLAWAERKNIIVIGVGVGPGMAYVKTRYKHHILADRMEDLPFLIADKLEEIINAGYDNNGDSNGPEGDPMGQEEDPQEGDLPEANLAPPLSHSVIARAQSARGNLTPWVITRLRRSRANLIKGDPSNEIAFPFAAPQTAPVQRPGTHLAPEGRGELRDPGVSETRGELRGTSSTLGPSGDRAGTRRSAEGAVPPQPRGLGPTESQRDERPEAGPRQPPFAELRGTSVPPEAGPQQSVAARDDRQPARSRFKFSKIIPLILAALILSTPHAAWAHSLATGETPANAWPLILCAGSVVAPGIVWDYFRISSKNSRGLRMGMLRQGFSANKSLSRETTADALPAKAHSKNLLSFRSRQSKTAAPGATTRASPSTNANTSVMSALESPISGPYFRNASVNSSQIAADINKENWPSARAFQSSKQVGLFNKVRIKTLVSRTTAGLFGNINLFSNLFDTLVYISLVPAFLSHFFVRLFGNFIQSSHQRLPAEFFQKLHALAGFHMRNRLLKLMHRQIDLGHKSILSVSIPPKMTPGKTQGMINKKLIFSLAALILSTPHAAWAHSLATGETPTSAWPLVLGIGAFIAIAIGQSRPRGGQNGGLLTLAEPKTLEVHVDLEGQTIVQMSPRGRWILTTGNGDFFLRDLERPGEIRLASIAPESKYFFSPDDSKIIVMNSVVGQFTIRKPEDPLSNAPGFSVENPFGSAGFSPDSLYFGAISSKGPKDGKAQHRHTVHIINTETQERASLEIPIEKILGEAIAKPIAILFPEGAGQVLAILDNGQAFSWDLASKKFLGATKPLKKWRVGQAMIRTLIAISQVIFTLFFTFLSPVLLMCSLINFLEPNATVRTIQTSFRSFIKETAAHFINTHLNLIQSVTEGLKFWIPEPMRVTQILPTKNHQQAALQAATFNDDGKGYKNTGFWMRDNITQDQRPLPLYRFGPSQQNLTRHRKFLAAISPDGARLITWDAESFFLSETKNGVNIKSFNIDGRHKILTFTNDSRNFVAAESNGIIRIFDADTGRELGRAGRDRGEFFFRSRHWDSNGEIALLIPRLDATQNTTYVIQHVNPTKDQREALEQALSQQVGASPMGPPASSNSGSAPASRRFRFLPKFLALITLGSFFMPGTALASDFMPTIWWPGGVSLILSTWFAIGVTIVAFIFFKDRRALKRILAHLATLRAAKPTPSSSRTPAPTPPMGDGIIPKFKKFQGSGSPDNNFFLNDPMDPDGRWLAIFDLLAPIKKMRFFNTASGEESPSFWADLSPLNHHLTFSPDGALTSLTMGPSISIRRIADGQEIKILSPPGRPGAISWSDNGGQFFAATWDTHAKKWILSAWNTQTWERTEIPLPRKLGRRPIIGLRHDSAGQTLDIVQKNGRVLKISAQSGAVIKQSSSSVVKRLRRILNAPNSRPAKAISDFNFCLFLIGGVWGSFAFVKFFHEPIHLLLLALTWVSIWARIFFYDSLKALWTYLLIPTSNTVEWSENGKIIAIVTKILNPNNLTLETQFLDATTGRRHVFPGELQNLSADGRWAVLKQRITTKKDDVETYVYRLRQTDRQGPALFEESALDGRNITRNVGKLLGARVSRLGNALRLAREDGSIEFWDISAKTTRRVVNGDGTAYQRVQWDPQDRFAVFFRDHNFSIHYYAHTDDQIAAMEQDLKKTCNPPKPDENSPPGDDFVPAHERFKLRPKANLGRLAAAVKKYAPVVLFPLLLPPGMAWAGQAQAAHASPNWILPALTFPFLILGGVQGGGILEKLHDILSLRELRVAGKTIKTKTRFHQITISGDGRLVAAIEQRKNDLRQGRDLIIFDATTGKTRLRFSIPFDPTSAVLWSPDSKLIGIAGITQINFWEASTGRPLGAVDLEKNLNPNILSAAIMNDRTIFVSYSFDMNRIFLAAFAIGSSRPLWKSDISQYVYNRNGSSPNIPNFCGLSLDEKAHEMTATFSNGTVLRAELTSGRIISRTDLHHSPDRLLNPVGQHIRNTPEGTLIFGAIEERGAVGIGKDNTWILHVKSGRRSSIPGIIKKVSPDGSKLIIKQVGIGRLEVWDAGGRHLWNVPADHVIDAQLGFTQNGQELRIADNDGRILKYDAQNGVRLGIWLYKSENSAGDTHVNNVQWSGDDNIAVLIHNQSAFTILPLVTTEDEIKKADEIRAMERLLSEKAAITGQDGKPTDHQTPSAAKRFRFLKFALRRVNEAD